MVEKELSEDVIADTNSEELIPDRFEDNLIAVLTTAPRGFVSSIGGKMRAFGPWLLRGGSNFRSIFIDPGPKAKTVYVKLRRELDTLTTFQLLAVLVTFTLFLILPLISVVAYSFTDPFTGLPCLVVIVL